MDLLKRIVDKMLVVHLLNGNNYCNVAFAEEPPGWQNNDVVLSFIIKTFITVD